RAIAVSVGPSNKTLFLWSLDPGFKFAPGNAEKIERLGLGTELKDGRHCLYVTSDNDLDPDLATQIYAFGVDASLFNFERQFLPGPLFPPGQVKKGLK